MTGTPLQRLCAHRGVTAPENGRLLDLAPVLGPDPGAQRQVREAIYGTAMAGIHRREVDQILGYARSLPTTNVAADQAGVPALETVTFGAVFGRLMRVRNLDVKGLAYATGSSFATVKGTIGDRLVPGAAHLQVIASALCLRGDDLEAMTGRPGEKPPADSIVARSYPSVWVVGGTDLGTHTAAGRTDRRRRSVHKACSTRIPISWTAPDDEGSDETRADHKLHTHASENAAPVGGLRLRVRHSRS